MKKILIIILILCSLNLFGEELKDLGLGLNIRIYINKDTIDNGTSSTETKDNQFELGGSLHYFKNEQTEYQGFLLIGYSSESNGVSEQNQVLYGLGGALYLHILNEERISAGFGGKLGLRGYLEPVRDPAYDYDSYFAGDLALELPLFADLSLHEKFLIRFSTVAAGLMMEYEYQEYQGLTEKSFNMNLFTAVDGYMSGTPFPLSIHIIYKL